MNETDAAILQRLALGPAGSTTLRLRPGCRAEQQRTGLAGCGAAWRSTGSRS